MTEIKMSDVFELPLEVEGQEIYDQSCDEVLTTDSSSAKAGQILDYAVAAINAYDPNQERIKELECAIRKMNKRGRIDMEAVTECYSMVSNNEKA